MEPKISMIPYANMSPYTCLGAAPGCKMCHMVPSESVRALKSGEVIAAAVPVGALPMLEDEVEMLGNFGIAAKGYVDSVMLFSRLPLSELSRPKKLHLTSQSATSVRLLYLLLGYTAGFDNIPIVVDDPLRADATLLIGDEALVRKKENRDPYIIDLVVEWERVHGTPFVFARWVVRKDASEKTKKNLLSWLSGIKGNEDRFIDEVAPKEAVRVGLSLAEMADYLHCIRRVLDDEDLRGQRLFLSELEKHAKLPLFDTAQSNIEVSARVDKEACIRLLETVPMGELSALAHRERMKRHPKKIVTYVMDTNPNYTNICDVKCDFCAFCKSDGDKGAYTLSPDEAAERIGRAYDKGASTVLLQGGHNPKARLEDWVAYIRAIKARCPDIHIHPFSPPEILDAAKKEGRPVSEILSVLRQEGIDTLPGGGAEILSDDVRKRIAPRKCSATEWLDVMTKAHLAGMRTTATMMFGHVEKNEHIAEHLLSIRAVQDKTEGFSSFIPWSFKPGNSALTAQVPNAAHPAKYIKIIAAARLALDNFDHIQSSWFSESERAGMLGLLAGADDFGGVLAEENVLKTSGYERRTTEAEVRDVIRRAGFTPALRDAHYRSLAVFDKEDA